MDYLPILKTILLIEGFLIGALALVAALMRSHEHHQSKDD